MPWGPGVGAAVEVGASRSSGSWGRRALRRRIGARRARSLRMVSGCRGWGGGNVVGRTLHHRRRLRSLTWLKVVLED